MNVEKLIHEYLSSKEYAWAPSTVRSEGARLRAQADNLDGNPVRLWKALEAQGMARYSRVTTWVRVVKFYDFCLKKGHVSGGNPYREWREENARQFKNAYEPKLPQVSFEEAKALIERIPDVSARSQALYILSSGLRSCEASQDGGEVTGKGGKRRRVYGSKREAGVPYHQLRRALQRVGLKPHTLRKVLLTELARQGLGPAELCQVAGWSDFKTAKSYIAASETKIQEAFKKLGGK